MSVKTALITGIAGQDGIYLTRFLRAKGYRVVGSSAPTSASLARLGPYLDGVEIVRVDVRDGVAMHELIVQTKPDERGGRRDQARYAPGVLPRQP